MNIFIAGGGRVGFQLARLLSKENHDVTVIEPDQSQRDHIDYTLDVSTVAGNALDALLLQELGAGQADLFISATGNDEVNLISATTAKGLGAKKVVARVESRIYNESDILYETIMGIDFILSPQALTAHDIATYIENPGMVAMESFGRGNIQMLQMRVTQSPLQPGETLQDIRLPKGVLLGVIHRGNVVEIPSGQSTIEANDVVTLVGSTESMDATKKEFQGVVVKNESVVIMGGSRTGHYLAETLENSKISVKLMDWDMDRCNKLAAELKKTKVVCRDATSRLALEQEHVDSADLFVAVTPDDERNIMACVLAKEVGVRETIAVVHQPDFASLVNKLGIDYAVTPRACIASRIMKLTTQQEHHSIAVLEDGEIEILEFTIDENCPVFGKQLSEIKFPKESLIASILRGDDVIVPTGDDTVLAEDSVIVITRSKSLDAVRKLFLS